MSSNHKYQFEAELEKDKQGFGCVYLPFDVPEVFGTKGQVRVKAKIDECEFRSSLFPMGGYHVLLIRKPVFLSIGKKVGQKVNVEFELDTEERIVEVPQELLEAFEVDEEAKVIYDNMSYSYRHEIADWINAAKHKETKINRVLKILERIKQINQKKKK
jgi:hypothetical protein